MDKNSTTRGGNINAGVIQQDKGSCELQQSLDTPHSWSRLQAELGSETASHVSQGGHVQRGGHVYRGWPYVVLFVISFRIVRSDFSSYVE